MTSEFRSATLDTRRAPHYQARLSMKAFAFTLVLTAMLLAGCESDMPPEKNRVNPIQRGIKGEGALVQPDQNDDPYLR